MANQKGVKLVFRAADAERVIQWPCTISVPADGGERVEQTLDVRFALMKSDTVQKYFDPLARVQNPDAPYGNIAFLTDAIAGFVDLKDEQGNPVPDEKAKALFLSLPYAVDGLVRGYFDMVGTRLPKN